MRKVKVETWKANVPERDELGNIIGTKLVDENLLVALNNLIGAKKPEDIPKGLDKFRLFNRLSKAFEKAEKTKELVLEESDYKFLKDTVEKDIPSIWGMSQGISKAIESFLEAKEM